MIKKGGNGRRAAGGRIRLFFLAPAKGYPRGQNLAALRRVLPTLPASNWPKRNLTPLCAVKRRRFSGGAIPPRQLSLQPVAIGAAMEVTISPEPLMERVALGDSASRQAVT
jgi:hypothetical protein